MTGTAEPARTADAGQLIASYTAIRRNTEDLCRTLAIEDYVIQAMPDGSPAKWHLAHVSWFFETFLLKPYLTGYTAVDERYEYLFNSYYNGVGPQFHRPERGFLSQPTVEEVYAFRRYVDEAVVRLLEGASTARLEQLEPVVTLGVNHEQQHQELLLTDIKYNLSVNPLKPAFHDVGLPSGQAGDLTWHSYEGGVLRIGHEGDRFIFDNEGPRHDVLLPPFNLASRLVTNGEFLEFVKDGAYGRHDLWLSQGWATVQQHGWEAPLYWERDGDAWRQFTLSGLQLLDPEAPVVHVSHFEADAFARWAGKRLPSEAEWEVVAAQLPIQGNTSESGLFHPAPLGTVDGQQTAGGPSQMFGDVWEWTGSAYLAYPGYRPPPGAIGEYNGKFMMSQMVLRGGSSVTPLSHIRPTYRNFFYPPDRWQFTGLRLADDA